MKFANPAFLSGSLLWFAARCTVLRSRWCQSGINIALTSASSCGSSLVLVHIKKAEDESFLVKFRLNLFRNPSVVEEHSIYLSHLRAGAAECSCAVYRELPIGGGGMPRELLDILGRKVAVALAVGSGVLDQDLGLPLR
jgi:hypothetical protein